MSVLVSRPNSLCPNFGADSHKSLPSLCAADWTSRLLPLTAVSASLSVPAFIRQIGRQGADLMLVPANDWKEIKHLHHRMAVYRAVENGVPMLRASSAVSGAVDAYGRVLATADHFAPETRTMVAQVPMGRVRTAYALVGNLFSWVSIAGLAGMIAWAAVRQVG
jgi:apolipoprotein N-acyltransferase